MDKVKYQIGEIRKGKEIGYKNPDCKWEWVVCPDCGSNEHWILYRKHGRITHKCKSCAHKGTHPTEETRAKLRLACEGKRQGSLNPSWKGGINYNHDGYKLVKIYKDDFFYPMANSNGYVFEHRLVMAKSLGRNLHSWEIVHHKNHIRTDNCIDNLQIFSDDRHKQVTLLEKRVRFLESRVTQLEAEIILLKSEGKCTAIVQ